MGKNPPERVSGLRFSWEMLLSPRMENVLPGGGGLVGHAHTSSPRPGRSAAVGVLCPELILEDGAVHRSTWSREPACSGLRRVLGVRVQRAGGVESKGESGHPNHWTLRAAN